MKQHLRTLVAGVGTNDAPYDVLGCPFYSRWSGMLKRCYSKREQESVGSQCYQGVQVCEEWIKSFMSFRSWMEHQEWEGMELDKDFKGDGTLYSPETCLFMPQWLNALFGGSANTELPVGVSVDQRCGKYRATLSKFGNQIGLGYFDTAKQAESAYIHEKMLYILMERGVPSKLLPFVVKRFKKRHPGNYVYLASKMRGLPEFNFPAFNSAAAQLRNRGFTVFNPAERDLSTGFDPAGMTGNEDLAALGFNLREALAADTEWICLYADAIFMLPGWQSSSGARAEKALGEALGLQIRYLQRDPFGLYSIWDSDEA